MDKKTENINPDDYRQQAEDVATRLPPQVKTKRDQVKAKMLQEYARSDEPVAVVEFLADEPETGLEQMTQLTTGYAWITGCYWPAVVVQIHTHATREHTLSALRTIISMVEDDGLMGSLSSFEEFFVQAKQENKDLESRICPTCGADVKPDDGDIPF